MEARLSVTVREQIRLALTVTNGEPRRVELRFPNGQTHDFTVLDSTGRTVWKWSEGRLFTQAMQSRVLEHEEIATYAATWDPGDLRGSFVAVVRLRSENHPVEQRASFDVP